MNKMQPFSSSPDESSKGTEKPFIPASAAKRSFLRTRKGIISLVLALMLLCALGGGAYAFAQTNGASGRALAGKTLQDVNPGNTGNPESVAPPGVKRHRGTPTPTPTPAPTVAPDCFQVTSSTFQADKSTPTLRFDDTPGDAQPANQYISLNNCGGRETAWIATVQIENAGVGPWLTLSNDHSALNPNESTQVAVEVNPQAVPTSNAVYVASITINNDYTTPETITVLLFIA